MAGGVAPKKQMDLSRYQRYERPDSLPKAREVSDPMTSKDKELAIKNIHGINNADPAYTEAFLKTKPILNTEY
jgi:hypothetical protein